MAWACRTGYPLDFYVVNKLCLYLIPFKKFVNRGNQDGVQMKMGFNLKPVNQSLFVAQLQNNFIFFTESYYQIHQYILGHCQKYSNKRLLSYEYLLILWIIPKPIIIEIKLLPPYDRNNLISIMIGLGIIQSIKRYS